MREREAQRKIRLMPLLIRSALGQKYYWAALLLFTIAATCVLRHLNPLWQCEQHFLELADAMLKGRFSLTRTDIDTAVFNGKIYSPYPITPAILYLPFVAQFGPHPVIPYLLCFAALVASGYLLFRISVKMALNEDLSQWLAFGLIGGTGLWCCLQVSYSAAYNAHIFSVFFTLAAIYEALSRSRAWLIGLLLGAAVTSRSMLVFNVPLVLVLAYAASPDFIKTRELLIKRAREFALGILPPLAITFLYNYARFENILETGYALAGRGDGVRNVLFDLKFVPRNLYALFLKGPDMDKLLQPIGIDLTAVFKDGILGSDMGTSLTFASPFLLAALLAPRLSSLRKKDWRVPVAWAGIVAAVAIVSTYSAIGMFQLNCARYTIDFLPALLILTIIGLKKRPEFAPAFKAAVAYSVALNFLFLTPSLAVLTQIYLRALR